jgi:hypothetical protein
VGRLYLICTGCLIGLVGWWNYFSRDHSIVLEVTADSTAGTADRLPGRPRSAGYLSDVVVGEILGEEAVLTGKGCDGLFDIQAKVSGSGVVTRLDKVLGVVQRPFSAGIAFLAGITKRQVRRLAGDQRRVERAGGTTFGIVTGRCDVGLYRQLLFQVFPVIAGEPMLADQPLDLVTD